MKDKLIFWFLQLFTTKIGWLVVSLVLALIFSILSNFYEWASILLLISLVWPVVFTIVSIIYAWIINPIRDHKNNKKK